MDFCWTPPGPSLLKLLCRRGVVPAPTPIPIPWPNMDRGESVVVNDLWRSMEPVGLSRRVGLLPEGGEPKLSGGGGRLMRLLKSSAPLKEPDKDDEFTRKDKRSKRDPGSSPRSLCPTLRRSLEGPVSRQRAGAVE